MQFVHQQRFKCVDGKMMQVYVSAYPTTVQLRPDALAAYRRVSA